MAINSEKAFTMSCEVTKEIVNCLQNIKNSFTNMTSKLPELVKEITQLPQNLINKYENTLSEIQNTVQENKNQLQDKMNNNINEIKQNLTNVKESLESNFTQYFNQNGDKIKQKNQDLISDLEKIVKVNENKITNVQQEIKKLIDNNTEQLNKYKEEYSIALGKMKEFEIELTLENDQQLKQIGDEITKMATIQLQETISTIETKKHDIQTISDDVLKLSKQFNEITDESVSGTYQAMKNKVQQFQIDTKTWIDNRNEQYRTLEQQLNNIIDQITQMKESVLTLQKSAKIPQDDDIKDDIQLLENIQQQSDQQTNTLQSLSDKLSQQANKYLMEMREQNRIIFEEIKQQRERQRGNTQNPKINQVHTDQINFLTSISTSTQNSKVQKQSQLENSSQALQNIKQEGETMHKALESLKISKPIWEEDESKAKQVLLQSQDTVNQISKQLTQRKKLAQILTQELVGKCSQIADMKHIPGLFQQLADDRKDLDKIMRHVYNIVAKSNNTAVQQ